LTHPQKRIWYVEKTFPGTSVSNISGTVRIKEKVDYHALEKAINHVVRINEGMRTRIIEQGTTPLQYYRPYHSFKVDFFDFTGKPLDELYKWDAKLSRIPLRFIDSDLYYFAMFKLSDAEGGFFCNFHHIITDAWTEMLLNSQIMKAYRIFCEGREPDVSPAPAYSEYIAREQKYLASDRFNKDREYWINQFTPIPDLVTLQTKKPSKKSLTARRKAFLLSREEAERIRKFCGKTGITVFSFFLTMLTIYINRITGSEDIVLGTPVLNRLNAREKSITGMFISTVPLRFRIDESASCIDYAHSITTNWLSVLRHQQYPYDLLQREVRKNHHVAENLFEITISYQNAKTSKEIQQWDGSTRWHFSGYQNEPLIIHINDRDDEGSLILNYDYNTSCFPDREIDFIHSHFKCLIDDALDNPDKPLHSLSIIGSEELQRIQGFNPKTSTHSPNSTFVELFQKQVDLSPAGEAVVFQNRPVSFAELDATANRLANSLRRAGLKRDDIVAVMLPRCSEIVGSMLGVIIAGGAFLPIDPAYPEDRIKYTLQNSCAKYIITTNELAARFSLNPRLVMRPDDERIAVAPTERPAPVNKPDDLAYIIYTSGSTGLAKGVMIKHSGLCSLVHALKKVMYFKPGEAVLSLSTVAFDLFILEVFPALVNGMKVVIADEKEQVIPSLQKNLILRHGVTKLLSTPMRMQLLLDDPGSRECFLRLKEIMIGGDVFPDKLLKRIKEVSGAEILNAYGPTEITIAATFKNLTNTNEINIGRPIDGSQVYILDKHMNMVPIGVPGEIYIGGRGLARGYLNNPGLTAERFIPSPFIPGERLYRTGDLGRWYPKGEIAFLGRVDSQVKIRGLRIELGEIENTIRRFPEVSDAVVLDIEDRSKKALSAYIVPKKGSRPDFKALRGELLKRLPGFMVPSYYMLIDEIPLNSSGKIDRRALPEPDRSQVTRKNFEPPTDPFEIKLSAIWERGLGVKNVGSGEDFFDLGGDSLDVVSLVTAVHAEFGVEMSISDIYELPTLQKQAARISELAVLNKDFASQNIIPLRRGGAESNLFMVHAGNGEVNNYYKLCRHFTDRLNYYGLRFLMKSLAPANLSITELASHYLEQVRIIQPNSPYALAGWCIGGTIAFEMARQLEASGEKVRLLALINSISPHTWTGVTPFSPESERAFLSSFLSFTDRDLPASATDLQELWNIVRHYIQSGKLSEQTIRTGIPDEAAAAIPNFCGADTVTLIKYVNTIRTLHNARAFYRPPGPLEARVCFIEASANDVIADKDGNLAGWQRYCLNPIDRVPVEGGHFSIFEPPHVEELAKALDRLLS
jgi:amino acid adenylation domain-containing protein